MRLPARLSKQWIAPLAVSVVLVGALVVSPAVGGPSVFGKKKVVKTIVKKVNATQVVSTAQETAVAPGGERLILSLQLSPGRYLVRSTFSLTRISQGVVTCKLRLGGIAEDASTSFADAPANAQEEESIAMETAGIADSATQAQLVCTSALSGTSVRYAEITAEKVPKLTVIPG